MLVRYLSLLPLIIYAGLANGQSCKTTAKFINDKSVLRDTMARNPEKRLVRLDEVIPGIAIDLRYATPNNFTGVTLYEHPVAYMSKPAAMALKQIQIELKKKGLGLKIFDAFRPFGVTCKMWEIVPDSRYAANPINGSNHNRGLAVDLTLIDLKTGMELDMGTGFDCFNDSAHHDFAQLPPKVLANRKLLRQVMWNHGFSCMLSEWWHYQWRTTEKYELIDLDFDEIKSVL